MRRRLLALLLAALSLIPSRLFAATTPPTWEGLETERTDLEAAATATRQQEEAAVSELFLLNRTLNELRIEIARLDREVERVAAEQAAAEAQRDRLEAQRKEREIQFGRRTRYYQEHGTFAPLGFLLDSSTFGDFLFRVDILTQVLQRDARLVKELRELKVAVENQERVLAAARAALITVREQQAAQAERQNTEIGRKEAFLVGLRGQRSQVEGRVAELEQIWTKSALPVLEAFSRSLQTVALKVSDLTPDSVQISLFPPGATVKVSEKNLNEFITRDKSLGGLTFRLRIDEVNLEGTFGGVTIRILGKFTIVSKTMIRYQPREIRFANFVLPQVITDELLAAGRLDVDYKALIGPWGMQELQMLDGAVTVRAGLQ